LLVVATTLLVLTESTASCVVPALIIPKLVAPSKPLTVASSKICTVSTEPFVPFLPATTVPILLPPAVLFLAAHDARTPSKSTLLSMQLWILPQRRSLQTFVHLLFLFVIIRYRPKKIKRMCDALQFKTKFKKNRERREKEKIRALSE
jgi:hypothetical protein